MSRYEWREGYGLWDSARGTYLLLGDDEHARILWAALNAPPAPPAVSAADADTLASIRDYLDRSGYKHWVAAFDRAMPAAPAVPEVLDAAKAALELLRGLPDDAVMPDHPIFGQLRRAIAKAQQPAAPAVPEARYTLESIMAVRQWLAEAEARLAERAQGVKS